MFYAVGITLWSATLYCDHKKDPSGGCRVCVCDRGDHPPPLGMWMTSHGQCPRGGGVLVNVQEWGLGVFFNLSEGG